MKHYLAIKRKKGLIHSTWTDPKITMSVKKKARGKKYILYDSIYRKCKLMGLPGAGGEGRKVELQRSMRKTLRVMGLFIILIW